MHDNIDDFLSQYSDDVYANARCLRKLLLSALPGITEQLDIPAKIVAYCYGQRYADMICVIIPSKKGLKLGLSRGAELPDPYKLLAGAGKISRYVVIESEKQIQSPAVKKMLASALKLYNEKYKAAK